MLAYNRTSDGLLAPLHDLVPSAVVRRPGTGEEAMGRRVAIFNPASNENQVSRLRVINPGGEIAEVVIEGIDDAGASPGTAVELTVPARASHTPTAQALESGQWEADSGVSGGLGDGKSGLTALTHLDLSSNRISDIGPLVSNPGLGRGDRLDVDYNPLNDRSCSTHIEALRRRGVRIDSMSGACR